MGDLKPVRKENGIENEQVEAKKEENKEDLTSEYVDEMCMTINGKIECLKKVCKWDNAEKIYTCQTNEAEIPPLFGDEKWIFTNLAPYIFQASPGEMIFRPIL